MVARQAGRTHTFYFIHPTTSKPIAFDRVNQPLLERRYKQLNDPDVWHSSHRGLSDRAHILVQDSYWPDSEAVQVDFHRMCVHAPSESGVMEKYRICRVKLDWEQEDMLKALQEQTPRDAMIREHRDRMMLMEVDRESTVDGVAFQPQSSSSFTASLGLSPVNPEQGSEDRESAQSPLPSRRSSSMYGLARRRSMMLAAGLGNPENGMMSRRRSQQSSPNTPDIGASAGVSAVTPSASDPTVYRSVRIDDDAAVQALVSRMRRAHQRSSLAQMQRSHRSTPNSGSTTQSNSPSLSPTLHPETSSSSLWHRRLSVAAGHASPSSNTPLRQYMDRRLSTPNNSVIRNMIMSELAAVQQQLHTPPLVSSPRHRSEATGGPENDAHTEAGIATIEDASTYRSGDDSTLSD